jgi:hypothetical protein
MCLNERRGQFSGDVLSGRRFCQSMRGCGAGESHDQANHNYTIIMHNDK